MSGLINMCGIAGRISWSKPNRSDTVRKMCETMYRRGPDDSGILDLGKIILGHRRLSIIDLSHKAKQPMSSLDKRYHIVYNGEIYNFRQLKKDLEKSGVTFKSGTDSEVVLYSYIHWGPASLDKFNGMFAFAIWDDLSGELFLARDRFGKKPLYYYMDEEKLVFASLLSALKCDNEITFSISYESLNCYLALGYILNPLTLYKEIFKLEPASYIKVSDEGKKVEKRCYWEYADCFGREISGNEDKIAGDLLDLLGEAVKRRMIADVPIGAFLSGGIDSSSVVSFMKKYHTGDLHTFSMGFESVSYNELEDAERAAKWIGTIHHNSLCRDNESLKLMDEAIDAYDEPFSDNSLIPTVELSKLTSSHVKVALSGDGADEIFAGYVTYKADYYYNYTRMLPSAFKRLMIFLGKNNLIGRDNKISYSYKLKQFFHGSLYSPEKAHYLWRVIFHPEDRVNILGGKFRDLIYDTDPFNRFRKYYENVKSLHWLDRNLYVDSKTWLTDDILVKVDRASMNSSLEVRSPYLDYELVGYAASIPADFKMKGLRTKYILKKALSKILPGFIIRKKKSGFNAPTGSWIGYDGVDEFRRFNKYVFDRKLNHEAE